MITHAEQRSAIERAGLARIWLCIGFLVLDVLSMALGAKPQAAVGENLWRSLRSRRVRTFRQLQPVSSL